MGANIPLQLFSHYPSVPVPHVDTWDMGDTPCPYFPDRACRLRAFILPVVDSGVYEDLLAVGFRRSGRFFYQPVCSGCRDCIGLRVPTSDFTPSKSQRRVWRKNQDLLVRAGPPELTDEKLALYRKYLASRHGNDEISESSLKEFLYESPVDTVELEYRSPAGALIGASLLDRTPRSLSSVYMYFDPEESGRSPGVFSVLHEIAWATSLGLEHYYLGFWLKECQAMAYKANYRPYEFLRTDGLWVR